MIHTIRSLASHLFGTPDVPGGRTTPSFADTTASHPHPPAVTPPPGDAGSWELAPPADASSPPRRTVVYEQRVHAGRPTRRQGHAAQQFADRSGHAVGTDGPAAWDTDRWIERARRLHANTPHVLSHLEQTVRVATQIAAAGRMYRRLTDADGYTLASAAMTHHLGAASALAVTGVPAIDGTMYLAQLGVPRLAALHLHHLGGARDTDEWGAGALAAAFPLDPLHDLLLLVDLHVDDDGRLTNPLHELDRRVSDPDTTLSTATFLRTQYHDILHAANELERWAGRFA